MLIGVIIEKGPKDWQIIQHENGCADIFISGKWIMPDQSVEARVCARVVKEDTGDSIVTWTECEHLEDNRWQVTIKGVPTGGLYRIETCINHANVNWVAEWGIRGDMIHHLGVGDVYVIAGQSNSAGYGKDTIYDPPEIGIHILKNSGKWDLASHPLNESTNTIHEETRESGNPGHSPYLNFARILKRDLGYPIGLIQAALGGSPLWMWNPDEDGVLYRNMMKTIKSQGDSVKGVLWYQGCSDTVEESCNTYLERFENMVSHIRKDLNDENLPILTVQLNRYLKPGNDIADRCWGRVREAQRQAAKTISNVFIVPALDCTLSDAIHNSSVSNMMLGERLAKTALTEIYSRNYICKAPEIVQAEKADKSQVLIIFKNVYSEMYTFDVDAKELPYTIVDGKGEVKITGYQVKDKKCILLDLERDLTGISIIHGAFEQNPKFFVPVDAGSHLPMLSFYGVEID